MKKRLFQILLISVFVICPVASQVGNYEVGVGAGVGAPPSIIRGGGVYELSETLMREIVRERKLENKPFYSGPINIAAPLISAKAYPVSSFPLISALLTRPVKPFAGPAKVVKDMPVVSPTITIDEVYSLTTKMILGEYLFANRIVVSKRDPPVDGIAAVAYADSLSAPILLTEQSTLPEATINAIKKLRPRRIIIVGGPVAIFPEVEENLKKFGVVERIWGETRYETAIQIAEKIEDPEVIVITDGVSPSPDAVIIAAEYNAPIVYTKGKEIPIAARKYLLEHRTSPTYGPVNWIVVGVDKGTTNEIRGIYTLPKFLSEHRPFIEIYKLGSKFFRLSD